MKTLRNKLALLALLIIPTCMAGSDAYAASVDLNIDALFGSGSGDWSWCAGSSCNKVAYPAVKNLGAVATLAHLHVATFEEDCPLTLSHVYTVSCSNGAVLTDVTSAMADESGSYVDWAGTTVPIGYRAPQRAITAGTTLCWRVDFGFGTPPGHAGYAGCHYEIEVRPASYDTDSDHAEHGTPLVNHGESLTWGML